MGKHIYPIECVICKTIFYSGNTNSLYCSKECRNDGRRQRRRRNSIKGYIEAITSYLKDRDGDFCAYCGNHYEKYYIDHYVPYSKGGAERLENFRLCCRRCNSAKGDKLIHELSYSKTFTWKP